MSAESRLGGGRLLSQGARPGNGRATGFGRRVEGVRCMCRLEERLDEAVPFGIGGRGSDEAVSPWA